MGYLFKAAILAAMLTGVAQADVGGKEKGTYHSDDKDVTTYKEIDGEYYKELHRSRFDKKDPNYYWMFDKAPCLYTEIWSAKYPCPIKHREDYHEDGGHHRHENSKPIPEPYTLLLIALGGIFLLAYRGIK